MARQDGFSGLTEFLAVARHSSFRAASAELSVTPGAISQAVKTLEARVGMPLFIRTTRSVALSEAGVRLLARLKPAAAEIGDALDDVRALRSAPSGSLRLSAPRIALDLVVLPILPGFRVAFPEIKVEIDVSDESMDLAARGFDAGIRIGRFIERDMVTVRLTPDLRWRVLGSPKYLARRGEPASPRELLDHVCIGYRFPTARTVYRWQFKQGRKEFAVEPPTDLVVNDHLSMIALAKAGVGLCYSAELIARRELKSGALIATLESYSYPSEGLFLYFPAKNQNQPKLRAFIDYAKTFRRQQEAG